MALVSSTHPTDALMVEPVLVVVHAALAPEDACKAAYLFEAWVLEVPAPQQVASFASSATYSEYASPVDAAAQAAVTGVVQPVNASAVPVPTSVMLIVVFAEEASVVAGLDLSRPKNTFMVSLAATLKPVAEYLGVPGVMVPKFTVAPDEMFKVTLPAAIVALRVDVAVLASALFISNALKYS